MSAGHILAVIAIGLWCLAIGAALGLAFRALARAIRRGPKNADPGAPTVS